jgi:hypothetical protein
LNAELRKLSTLLANLFCCYKAKASRSPSINNIDGGRLAGLFISPVHDDSVRRGSGAYDHGGNRGRGGYGGHYRDGHDRPGSADRDDEGSDDVAPNAHDSSMRLPRSTAPDLDPAAAPTNCFVRVLHSPVNG